MNIEDAIEVLKKHNEWRRGAEIPQEDPHIIGMAIDVILHGYKNFATGPLPEPAQPKEEIPILESPERPGPTQEERGRKAHIDKAIAKWAKEDHERYSYFVSSHSWDNNEGRRTFCWPPIPDPAMGEGFAAKIKQEHAAISEWIKNNPKAFEAAENGYYLKPIK